MNVATSCPKNFQWVFFSLLLLRNVIFKNGGRERHIIVCTPLLLIFFPLSFRKMDEHTEAKASAREPARSARTSASIFSFNLTPTLLS